MKIECGICFEPLGEDEEGGPITALVCGHLLHENCVNTWMIQDASCPHCRKRISRTDLRRVFFTNINHRQSINPLNSTMVVQNYREIQEDLLSVQTTNELLIENQKMEIELYKQDLAEEKYKIEELMDQLAAKDEKITELEGALAAKDDEVNDLVRERDMLRGKTSVRRTDISIANNNVLYDSDSLIVSP